jgi:hypothetical protein
VLTATATECPGVGKCHNASWCADCDVTALGPCDVRARGERCDAHPSAAALRPLLEEARHDVDCAGQDAGNAAAAARVAEREAQRRRADANRFERRLRRAESEMRELQTKLTAALADELSTRA